ncbi:small s protein [Lasiosphaeria ovina]|uniref:Small s protein n=1 Tax=Lasiosphaeria ovina TaxID=92902 RepID=A0AAE0KJ62_9PEZI|nr:small s protein [Lasiosphaeria ovina]
MTRLPKVDATHPRGRRTRDDGNVPVSAAMDPLTALSVATGVVSFVDFGSKLLSNSRKLYKSSNGVLTENVDLQIIALDIATLAQGLRRNLPEHRPLSNSSKKGSTTFGDDGALDAMCRRSVEIASELMAQLDKLKVDTPPPTVKDKDKKDKKSGNELAEDKALSVNKAPQIALSTSAPAPSKTRYRDLFSVNAVNTTVRQYKLFRSWESFRKALEASWKKEEIEDLAATLREFRGEIEFRMLLMFRGSLNDLAAQQSHASRELAQATRLILDASLQTRDSLTHQLRQQAERLMQIKELQEHGRTRDITKDDNFFNGTLGRVGHFEAPRQGEDVEGSDAEMSCKDGQIQEELRLLMIENGILESLSFASSTDRQQSVELPYRGTFGWIFDDSGTSENRWSSLTEWLRTGSGIYWINGKVGSGKSTLMKYIYENSRTAEELEQWAAGMPLEVSAFFFWNSGDEYQKSQLGLLRSLLHDVLGRHRDLLPTVLPDAWDAWSLRATSIVTHKLPKDFSLLPPEPTLWTIAQLERAFGDLIHNLHLQRKVKLCLFIDGLDEYSGDHTDLIDLFRGFARLPNLKLCVSSRPLLAFCTAFDQLPGLRLQDLTEPDISRYVHDRLGGGGRTRLSGRYSLEARALEKDIVQKAQGVFLWVKLVVKSLAKGISDYTRISDLRRRVDHLPGDLEALYAHMLANVTDQSYHEQASQIFQIVQAVRRTSAAGITLLRLSWAEDEDFDLAESAPIRPITRNHILERCEIMDARLKSICAGLLESVNPQYSGIAPDAKVVFLHRTVYDWISKPRVWESIIRHTAGSGFSPNLCMLRSCVLQLKAFDSSVNPLDMTAVADALAYARAAEADLNCGFPKLLDQLDVVVSYHWRASNASAQHRQSYANLSNELSFFKDADLDGDEEDDMVGRTQRIKGGLEVVVYENHLQHWSCGVEVPGIKTRGESSTFFDLVKDLGLIHYVTAKDQTGEVVDQDVNVHILHHALSELGANTPDPCFIEEILSAGTNPNLAYCGITPWEAALAGAASHFWTPHDTTTTSNKPSSQRTWERDAEAWANILQTFLRHGADPTQVAKPRQVLIHGPLKLSPMLVVDMLPETLESKSAELKVLLSSSNELWKRRTGGARKRTVNFSGDGTGTTLGSVGSVNSREELNKARVASAVGWLGWVVSWLPG